MGFIAQPDIREQRTGTFRHLILRQAAQLAHRHHHIIERRKLLHQKVKLENKPDMFAARRRTVEIAAVGHQLITDPNGTVIGLIEQTEQIKQRTFATSRRTDNRSHFTTTRLKRNATQHVHPALSFPEVAVQFFATQREFGIGFYRGAHCEVPRIISPGSSRAARRAGITAAVITTMVAQIVATM